MRLSEKIDKFLGSAGKLDQLKLGIRASRYLAALLLQDFVATDELRDMVFGREYPASWENQLSLLRAEVQASINIYAKIKNQHGKGRFIDEAERTALREILSAQGWEGTPMPPSVIKPTPAAKEYDREWEWKVDKGVPLPSHGRHKSKYKWEEMEIGDSVLVWDVSRSGLQTILAQFRKKHPELNYSFATREEGEGATRVWRVEPDPNKKRGGRSRLVPANSQQAEEAA